MKDLRNHNILVVGSSNTDMVIKTNHLPRTGESIKGRALGKTVNFVWTAKASHFGGGGIA